VQDLRHVTDRGKVGGFNQDWHFADGLIQPQK
jgi:hypothetical protein